MNRRESLAVVASAAATLAGCSGFASNSSEALSETPAADRSVTDGPGSGSETEPDVLAVRVDTDGPPLWLADSDSDDGGRPTVHDRRRYLESTVLDTQSRADRLTVADDVDRQRVDSFLTGTDFATETLYLGTVQVEKCFRLDLCRIAWRSDKVSTDYAQRVRPYDERCGVDEYVFEARLVRIPDALDAAAVNTYSSSIGGGHCDRDGPDARAEEAGGSGSSTPTEANTTATGGDQ
jgi:hypothetical protein